MTYKSSNIDYRNAVMNNVKAFVEYKKLDMGNRVCLLQTYLDLVTKNRTS